MTRRRLAWSIFAPLGAVLSGLAVGAGAFGAHALRARLDARALETFETAARYQMYHGLALLFVALLLRHGASVAVQRAGWCFVAGTVIFSGSLYGLTLSGLRSLGAVTPVGGVLLIAGWGLLALGLLRPTAPRSEDEQRVSR